MKAPPCRSATVYGKSRFGHLRHKGGDNTQLSLTTCCARRCVVRSVPNEHHVRRDAQELRDVLRNRTHTAQSRNNRGCSPHHDEARLEFVGAAADDNVQADARVARVEHLQQAELRPQPGRCS